MSAFEFAWPRPRLAARAPGRTASADLWLLLLAGLVLFGAGLGLRDPWPADEPRFALIARDMLRSGQWLIPHIGGEPYSDKPPLFMWLTAGLYAVTGELRVAFLLPSLLAGLGMLALVHDLARRLWNRRVAFAAGLLLLATLQFTMQARSAQLDALVTFWTTLGLYGLLRHLLLGPQWRWYAAGGFAMGLGIITKGVGFLPLFVFLPWGWVRWRRPDALPRLHGGAGRWALAPAAMLLPIACWLLPMLLAVAHSGDPALAAYRDDLLFHQTATRYAHTWTHLRPAWYYVLEVMPWAWLPATLALPWLLPAWRRRLARGDARYWLLLGYLAAVVVFFSLSPGKRDVYLLPALPAFVLAVAPLLAAGLLHRPWLRSLCAAVPAVVAITALAAAVALIADVQGLRDDVVRRGVPVAGAVTLLGATGLAALALTAWGVATRSQPAALGALLATGWMIYGWLAYPLLNDARSGIDVMARAQHAVPLPQPLALVGWPEQLLLHAARPVDHFGFRRPAPDALRDAVAWLAEHPDGRLVIAAAATAPCLDATRAQPLAFRHRRQWLLAGREALTGDCPAAPYAQPPRHYDPATGGLAAATR